MPRETAQIADVTLSYWEQGQGPTTLLLLHGSNQSYGTFSPQLTSPLLSGHRIIALDLPGHGESSPCNHPSMIELTNVIAQFVREKIAQPFVIVGFSLGGHIALGLLKAGLTPKGLVLMATPPASRPINMLEMFQVSGPMGLLYKPELESEELMSLARALYHEDTELTQELADIQKVAISFKEKFAQTLMSGEHIDEQEFIKTLTLPTMVAIAEHDRFVQNQLILQHLPLDPLLKRYSTGHNLHREAASAFTADLARFVTNIL